MAIPTLSDYPPARFGQRRPTLGRGRRLDPFLSFTPEQDEAACLAMLEAERSAPNVISDDFWTDDIATAAHSAKADKFGTTVAEQIIITVEMGNPIWAGHSDKRQKELAGRLAAVAIRAAESL